VGCKPAAGDGLLRNVAIQGCPQVSQNGPQMPSGVIILQFEAFIMLAGLHKVVDFGIAADNMAIFLLLSANFGDF